LGSAGAATIEIIVDNKVFDGSNGLLRYSGLAAGPRSRTVIVANVLGTPAPQVITGAGLYQSSGSATTLWTGSLGWVSPSVSTTAPSLIYPAVAELDQNSQGPEIVVTDLWGTRLRVLSSQTGTELAAVALPNGSSTARCGGPPMIGDAIYSLPGNEIGVASCTRYTLFRYGLVNGLPGLGVLWSAKINDPGGQTTSTLYRGAGSGRIVYADQDTLWVFNGTNGAVLQKIRNTSNTAIEGPVVASLDTGVQGSRCTRGPGEVIVAANNYASGASGQTGVRIFSDTGPGPGIGMVGSCWNQHTFHVTNVESSSGIIPTVEPASWLPPARNGYRTQQ
jgi:hypothetical protein